MEKEARLILAQIDHVSGEILGYSVEKLQKLGARNVQLIPSITKKNRPGTLLIVDIPPEKEAAIAEFLASELKVSGYHRLHSTHVYQAVQFVKKNLIVSMNGSSRSYPCEIKVIGDPKNPLVSDVEHEFLVQVQEDLYKEFQKFVSLGELRALVDSGIHSPEPDIRIDLGNPSRK